MAGELAVAVVKTEVDLAGIDKGFNEAEGKTNASLASLGGNVGKVLTGVVLGAVVAVVAAIGAIGAAAFDVSSQFQSATNNIRAQLGLTAEEAERLGDVVANVYANNFGQSIEEVGQAIAETVRQLGDLGVTAEQDIQRATENAFMLRDAFDIDVGESLAAVRTLMQEFGLTSDEAFDLITTGFQEVPAFARDGLDTIGEYSNLFSDAGFSAEEMFSIMESGAEGGQLATDKVADAVKEMGIRLNEGAAGVSEAFDSIGLDFDEIQQSVADGETTWADWFDNIIGGLNDIEDPILRNQAAVGIFGTMAEDLGLSFVEGLDPGLRGLEDMAGRTEGLNVQYANFSDFVQGTGRRFQVALKPLGDALLNIAMSALPLVEGAFGWFETTLVPILEAAGGFVENFFANIAAGQDPVMSLNWALNGLLAAFGLSFEQIGQITTAIWNFYQGALAAKDAIVAFLAPIVEAIMQFVSWKDILIILGAIIGVVVVGAIISLIQAIAPVIAVVLAAVAIVAVLRNAWENDWGGIRTFLIDAWEGTIRPALEQLWAWLQVNIPAAIQTLKAFWENTLLPAIQNVWAWVQGTLFPTLATLWDWLSTQLTAALTTLGSFWTNTLQPAIQNVWQWVTGTLLPTLSELWIWLKDTLTAALTTLAGFWTNTLQPAINTVWGFITNDLMPLFEALREMLGLTLTLAITALETAWLVVLKPALDTIWGFIKDNILPVLETMWEWLDEKLTAAFGALSDVWKNTLKPALEALKNLLEGPAATAAGIFEGAINGIKSAIDFFVTALQTVAGWIQTVIDLLRTLQNEQDNTDTSTGGGDDGGGDAQGMGFFEHNGGGLLGPGMHQPAGAATPAWMGGGTVNNFNLTVSSGRSMEDIVSDFYLMQAAAL